MKVLGAALLLGAAVAWVDTRPSWDDTGISALLLVLGAAALAAAAPDLWPAVALAVTLPLVVANVVVDRNWGALLALPFGLAGALIGSLPRRMVAGGH